MDAFLAAHRHLIEIATFYGAIAVMALWELLAPFRPAVTPRLGRWFDNLLLTCCNAFLIGPLLLLLGWAVMIDRLADGFGLFHRLALPYAAVLILSILALDLVGYGMHLANHFFPPFWRYHRVHHADRDVDVSTGLRFHPFEAATTALTQGAAIALLGVPPGAVIAFGALATPVLMLQHGNVTLPPSLERLLRLVIPTPDYHRIHHSAWQPETDSNFGATFSVWDYLFCTYRQAPRQDARTMTIGLAEFNDARYQNILRLLWLPFIGKAPRT